MSPPTELPAPHVIDDLEKRLKQREEWREPVQLPLPFPEPLPEKPKQEERVLVIQF